MVTWCGNDAMNHSSVLRVPMMKEEKKTRPALSRVLLGPAFLAALVAVLVWLIPSPVEPICGRLSEEGPPAFVGPLAPNNILSHGRMILQGQVLGPESFAVDSRGAVYTGLGDGRVVRIVDGLVENVTQFGLGGYAALCSDPSSRDMCGRPLGMDFQQDGRLYVIDTYHGLYAVNVDTGEQELIWDIKSDVFGGERVGFANAYTVLPNGSFLITDTSERHRHVSFALSFLEFQSQGKLVIYNPETKETHALLQNLSFPNGLLLSKDGSYVLVSEMGYARILKYHLQGPKAGTYDVFISNLPGMPDNLSYSKRGTIWVPLCAIRHNFATDFLVENAWLRKLICKFRIDLQTLSSWLPGYGLILEVDTDGTILGSYHDPQGAVLTEASEVIDLEDKLYIGSYHSSYIVELEMPEGRAGLGVAEQACSTSNK